jgi:hypothetical protein
VSRRVAAFEDAAQPRHEGSELHARH